MGGANFSGMGNWHRGYFAGGEGLIHGKAINHLRIDWGIYCLVWQSQGVSDRKFVLRNR
jgi:hypothetical protein